ncbi:MAG: hypothetical protein PHO02_04220 [Candidatus Nanoarchaeia archaeon]|nr:hypothetical protein [Candidatus Nanoarchaeia archaeon]
MGLDSITGMAVSISDSNLQLPAAIAVFLIVAMGAQLLLKRTAFSVIAGIVCAAALMGMLYLF